eukprot:5165022-Prymnesium_polylepis.2
MHVFRPSWVCESSRSFRDESRRNIFDVSHFATLGPRTRRSCERRTPAIDYSFGIATAMLELFHVCSAEINRSGAVAARPPLLARARCVVAWR